MSELVMDRRSTLPTVAISFSFPPRYLSQDYTHGALASFVCRPSFVVPVLTSKAATLIDVPLYLSPTTLQILWPLGNARWHRDGFCWLVPPRLPDRI